ncbi:MAG: hypothetical protein U0841_16200 [Chloroflexia bacterium]
MACAAAATQRSGDRAGALVHGFQVGDFRGDGQMRPGVFVGAQGGDGGVEGGAIGVRGGA